MKTLRGLKILFWRKTFFHIGILVITLEQSLVEIDLLMKTGTNRDEREQEDGGALQKATEKKTFPIRIG